MHEPYDYAGDVPYYVDPVDPHSLPCKFTGKVYPSLARSEPDDYRERIPEWRIDMRLMYANDVLDVIDADHWYAKSLTKELRKYFPRRPNP
jgi:hypothetical protein